MGISPPFLFSTLFQKHPEVMPWCWCLHAFGFSALLPHFKVGSPLDGSRTCPCDKVGECGRCHQQQELLPVLQTPQGLRSQHSTSHMSLAPRFAFLARHRAWRFSRHKTGSSVSSRWQRAVGQFLLMGFTLVRKGNPALSFPLAASTRSD